MLKLVAGDPREARRRYHGSTVVFMKWILSLDSQMEFPRQFTVKVRIKIDYASF